MRGIDITVVIPAHNAGGYIIQALESVAAQTVQPVCVIVVNNASTDDTASKVLDYAKTSSVPIVHTETNFGDLSNARNIGFSLSSTAYIAMLDADDLYRPGFLEQACQVFSADHTICCFFGNRTLFDASGARSVDVLDATSLYSMPMTQIGTHSFRLEEDLFGVLAFGNFISPSGAVVTRCAAYSARLFSLRLPSGEDREFFCRLSLQGAMAFTRNTVVDYRLHDGSLMASSGELKLCKNNLRSLIGLMVDSDNLRLNGKQRKTLRVAIRRTSDKILFLASQNGVRRYLCEWYWMRCVDRPRIPRVKDIARALMRSFGWV